MNAAVELRSVVCVMGTFPVLVDVDFEVAAGQCLVVRGENGAGKSTLLRLIAGLECERSGFVRVLGERFATHGNAIRRRIAFIGHEPSLYEDLTLVDNVEFAQRCFAGHSTRANALVSLLQVGITEERARVVARDASAGQRRRTAVAMAMAKDADLWILDEPHSGLDVEGRKILDSLCRNLCKQGKTVIVATHEDSFDLQNVVMRSCLVEHGALVETTTHVAPKIETDVVNADSTTLGKKPTTTGVSR